MRRFILFCLIMILSFNFLLAQTANYSLSKPLKVKLAGYKKIDTYLLCFTEKGFVTYNNSLFSVDYISKFAAYHSLEELEYFQLDGKINFYPFLIGGAVVVAQASTIDEDDEYGAIGLLFTLVISTVACSVLSLLTMLIPRYSTPDSEKDIQKFPEKYVTFNKEIPPELQEFIDIYEE